MLEKEIWGNTVQEWGISLLIILGAIIIAKVITLFVRKVIKPYASRTRNKLDDILFNSLESPIVFGIILLGFWIAIHRLVYPDSFVKVVDSAYKILIVLNITWFFARLFSSIIDVYWIKNNTTSPGGTWHSSKMLPVVKRTILVIVWIVGIIMALSNVGVNISTLLGTLGIGGIAFALAAQDTIKNIFGAFTIFADKPFAIGDTIRVDNFEGTIVDVGVRSTKLQDYDKRIVTFPNYKLTDASIINISSEPMRRVVMKIGLTYDTPSEKMTEAMNILRGVPKRVKFVSPNDLIVNFSDYTDSALVITFIYFIEKAGDIGGTTSDVNMDVLASFNKAGLEFAFPSRTIYLEKDLKEEIASEKEENTEKEE